MSSEVACAGLASTGVGAAMLSTVQGGTASASLEPEMRNPTLEMESSSSTAPELGSNSDVQTGRPPLTTKEARAHAEAVQEQADESSGAAPLKLGQNGAADARAILDHGSGSNISDLDNRSLGAAAPLGQVGGAQVASTLPCAAEKGSSDASKVLTALMSIKQLGVGTLDTGAVSRVAATLGKDMMSQLKSFLEAAGQATELQAPVTPGAPPGPGEKERAGVASHTGSLSACASPDLQHAGDASAAQRGNEESSEDVSLQMAEHQKEVLMKSPSESAMQSAPFCSAPLSGGPLETGWAIDRQDL